MLPRALVKESKSWLTLSRQKDDTRQSAPEGGKNPGDNGQDWCTSRGSTLDTTERRRVAFSAQADELEKIKRSKTQLDICLLTDAFYVVFAPN